MTTNTVLWRRSNGMFTRHELCMPERSHADAFKRSLTRYSREVFNAFPEVVAVEVCDGVTKSFTPMFVGKSSREECGSHSMYLTVF